MNRAFLPPTLSAERVVACFGLISDTHMPKRWRELPPAVFDLLQGVDLVLHAGDVGELWVLDQLSTIAPTLAVHGNDVTEEAQRELQQTEAEFQASQERDAFLTTAEARLAEGRQRLEEMEARSENLSGEEKEALEAKTDDVESAVNNLEEQIDEAKSVEINKWREHEAAVNEAVKALDTALEAAQM